MALTAGTAIGFGLVVMAALSWATANVIVKRVSADAPLAVVVWASAAACVPLAAAALIVDGPQRVVRGLSWALRGAVARRCLPGVADDARCIGHLGVAAAPKSAATVAPFTLLVPVVGMSCAVAFLDEPVTWWKLADPQRSC